MWEREGEREREREKKRNNIIITVTTLQYLSTTRGMCDCLFVCFFPFSPPLSLHIHIYICHGTLLLSKFIPLPLSPREI